MGGLADHTKVGCNTSGLRGDEVVWRRLDKELLAVVVVVPVRLPFRRIRGHRASLHLSSFIRAPGGLSIPIILYPRSHPLRFVRGDAYEKRTVEHRHVHRYHLNRALPNKGGSSAQLRAPLITRALPRE